MLTGCNLVPEGTHPELATTSPTTTSHSFRNHERLPSPPRDLVICCYLAWSSRASFKKCLGFGGSSMAFTILCTAQGKEGQAVLVMALGPSFCSHINGEPSSQHFDAALQKAASTASPQCQPPGGFWVFFLLFYLVFLFVCFCDVISQYSYCLLFTAEVLYSII